MGDTYIGVHDSIIVNRNAIYNNSDIRGLIDELTKALGPTNYQKESLEKLATLSKNPKNRRGMADLWQKIKQELPNAAHIATCADAITNIITSMRG